MTEAAATSVPAQARDSAGRTLARYAGFPALYAGGLAVAWLCMQYNVHSLLTTACVVGPLFLSIVAMEHYIPYHREWNKSHGDTRSDVLHYMTTLAVSPFLKRGLLLLLTLVAAKQTNPFDLTIWPAELPVAAQLIPLLIVSELIFYWLHRSAHMSSGMWWRLHATHHGAERVYWLNAVRLHPLYFILINALPLLLFIVLGVPEEVMIASGFVGTVAGFMAHVNADFRCGPLNYLLNTPVVHRWHHLRDASRAQVNFGGTLMLWDLVFRTFSLPGERLGANDVGLHGDKPFPQTFSQLMLYPFTGARAR